ncbi:MAG: hypothetical protein IJN77_09005 [Oscillospiraceae bacterium]|nr:hypothetical protein [Oscillospiraceae bacterium]
MCIKKSIQTNGVPLIKFQNKARIDYFQKGKIYLKSLAYFRKREKDTNDDTVGDLFDAMVHTNEGYLVVPELGVCQELTDTLIETSFSNCFVFCMFSPKIISQKFQFSEDQKRKLLDFGDSALVITDRYAFLQRVAIALKRDGITGYHGHIKYYDETSDNVEYWASLIKNGIKDVAFWKRQKYEYQQEYRFLIEPPVTENDYYELEIGDISDISIILTAQEALNLIAFPIKSDDKSKDD